MDLSLDDSKDDAEKFLNSVSQLHEEGLGAKENSQLHKQLTISVPQAGLQPKIKANKDSFWIIQILSFTNKNELFYIIELNKINLD